MRFYLLPFIRIQLARFIQYGITHTQLADVMQQRTSAQPSLPCFRESHGICHGQCISCNPAAMPIGVGTFRIDYLGKCFGYGIQAVFINPDHSGFRFQQADFLLQAVVGQTAPEIRLFLDLIESIHHIRIKPRTRTFADFLQGKRCAASGMEYIDDLRQQSDSGIEGYLRTHPSRGFAVAVPVFVQTADACCHLIVEAKLASNAGAAFATRSNQFSGELIAILGQIHNAGNPLMQRFSNSCMGKYESPQMHQTV